MLYFLKKKRLKCPLRIFQHFRTDSACTTNYFCDYFKMYTLNYWSQIEGKKRSTWQEVCENLKLTWDESQSDSSSLWACLLAAFLLTACLNLARGLSSSFKGGSLTSLTSLIPSSSINSTNEIFSLVIRPYKEIRFVQNLIAYNGVISCLLIPFL